MSKVKFTTTIEEELLKKIKIKAIESGTSVSNLLEIMISGYLRK